jgi:hypothetical protein
MGHIGDYGRWRRAPSQLRLGAEIVWTAVRVRRLVRTNDLPAVVARCRENEHRSVATPARSELVCVGRTVRKIVGLLPGNSSPLVSSLVLIAVLARRGVDTSLVIGMRGGEQVAPTAWVEISEAPVPRVRHKFAQLVAL